MPIALLAGKLKIFLGYAAGVGKTYQMLEEAQEAKRQGIDVVIGYFEPHGRKDTIAKTEGLEMIPRRKIDYRGGLFEEMDTDAILRRHPELCVVDEFPHTNVPGSERLKRWQDVQVLLDAGIDVLTTMNIQHLESLNDQIWNITGIRVRETIPDWVMQQADQVVMVDLTPRALLNRLARGVVYSQEKAQKALENFFQESTLVVLRELALRQTAHEVEIRQVDYDAPGFEPEPGVSRRGRTSRPENSRPHLDSGDARAGHRHADPPRQTRGGLSARRLFRRGGSREIDLHDMPARDREAVEHHLNFARNLHIETRVLQGQDVAKTLVEFAHLNGVTHLFLARPQPEPMAGFVAQKPGAASGPLGARHASDHRGRPQPTDSSCNTASRYEDQFMPDNKTVFLFDVDNTLLDNDHVTADLKRHLQSHVGLERSQRYWQRFEEIRTELGYADYLGALQRYRFDYPHDPNLLTVSYFLMGYPFANRLFPNSVDAVQHVGAVGAAGDSVGRRRCFSAAQSLSLGTLRAVRRQRADLRSQGTGTGRRGAALSGRSLCAGGRQAANPARHQGDLEIARHHGICAAGTLCARSRNFQEVSARGHQRRTNRRSC